MLTVKVVGALLDIASYNWLKSNSGEWMAMSKLHDTVALSQF